MIYDEEDLHCYLSDVFNGLTYTLVKHYDFSMPELVHFFDLYEQETEYKIKIDFNNPQQFEDFKKISKDTYYKDIFGQD